MIDIEAKRQSLLKNSKTYQLTLLGNPDNPQGLTLPDQDIGLFDIERKIREPIENLAYNSPDPDGALQNFDTAVMFNHAFGMDMDKALKLAENAGTSAISGVDFEGKNYFGALKATAQNSWNQEMKGINTSLYQISGDPRFMRNAEAFANDIRKNPVTKEYGTLGNLGLDSVQPMMSSAKFMLTTALMSWLPAGLAVKTGAKALQALAKAGGVGAQAVNFLSAGYSQAGNILYEVMNTEDINGNKLPWDSPVGSFLFHSLALTSGAVELVSFNQLPFFKALNKSFTKNELTKHLEKGIVNGIKNYSFEVLKSIGAEASEEGVQYLLQAGCENLLKEMANKEGADFTLDSPDEVIAEAVKQTIEAAKSMILTSMISGGMGQGVYTLQHKRLSAESGVHFNKEKGAVSVDASFVTVKKGLEENSGEQVKRGEESQKLAPVRVVNAESRLVPVNEAEARKAAEARTRGAKAMNVIVEEMREVDASDKVAFMNQAALASGGKLSESGEEIVYESVEDLVRAVDVLQDSIESVKKEEGSYQVVVRGTDGELNTMNLRLAGEEETLGEPDFSYADDINAPHSLSRMAQDRAEEYAERELVKDKLSQMIEHTGGRIAKTDLEANVDAVILVANTLNIPTDELLEKNVLISFEEFVKDGEGNDTTARGSITQTGERQYTIHISKTADVSTLLHELGHTLRGLASQEQLSDFKKHYGIDGLEAGFLDDIVFENGKYRVGGQEFASESEAKQYATDVEERFADDFVAYLMTGQAPTAELKNIFGRMKDVLTKLLREFKDRLTPEVRQSFDRLISGQTQHGNAIPGLPNSGPIPVDVDGNVLFQGPSFETVREKYIDTDKWMKAPNGKPTNLTEDQWISVRTPEFKAWFGDWEPSANFKWLMESDPVIVLSGEEFKKSEIKLSDQVSQYYAEKHSGIVNVPGIGNIFLSERGVKSSISHGIGRSKAVAFAAVPAVLMTGKIFSTLENYKDRGYTSTVIAAPIDIDGTVYIAEVVINKSVTGEANYYLHEVDIRKKLDLEPLQDTSFKGDSSRSASKLIVSYLRERGKFNASKVVDENGEPRVVFHGSKEKFSIFDFSKLGNNTGWPDTDIGFYFTSDRRLASGFGLTTEYSDATERRAGRQLIQDALELIRDDGSYISRVYDQRGVSNGPDITGVEMRRRIESALANGTPFFAENKYNISTLLLDVFSKEAEDYSKFSRRMDRLRKTSRTTSENVYEVFLNIRNPSYSSRFEDLNADNDGVILNDFTYSGKTGTYTSDIYVVSDSETQIKSVNNTGSWDPNNPNILYQLSPKARKEIAEKRHDDVRMAVEEMFYVPLKILQEYAGEEWADKELELRRALAKFPWILEEARMHPDEESFFNHLQEKTELGDFKWSVEDELWYARIFAYSRIMTPADRDKQFVRMHTATDRDLIELGQMLKGYRDVGVKNNKTRKGYSEYVQYNWGSFKGVSTKVKALSPSSSKEEIQEARRLIEANPRPYRKALNIVLEAEDRVMAMKAGDQYGHSQYARENYFDTLGEEIEEELKGSNIGEMTDREVAKFYRETEDREERAEARDRLATRSGVLAMERQLEKELKGLGIESQKNADKIKKELKEARSKNAQIQKELDSALSDFKFARDSYEAELKKVKALQNESDKKSTEIGKFRAVLNNRREKLNETRRQLTESRNRVKALESQVKILKKRAENQRLKKDLERLHAFLRKRVKFNPDIVDASYQEAMDTIYDLLDENQKQGKYELLPEKLRAYLNEEALGYVQRGRNIGQWTKEELLKLIDAVELMRMDAKIMLEQKKLMRSSMLQSYVMSYYKQTYGESPEVTVGYGSVVPQILKELGEKRSRYSESGWDSIKNIVLGAIIHSQRLARLIDGDRTDGVMTNLLVRQVYKQMSAETENTLRRLEPAEKKMKELGLTSAALSKDFFTYTTMSGDKIHLTLGQTIGLYVYSQNSISSEKLQHASGNGISFPQLADAISKLSDNQKAWGDYMIDTLGGDETWERMAKVYYEVYNKNLGRRDRYFTFVADGVENEGMMDTINGAMKDSLRWVDKGMTKEVNIYATYPLKLDVTSTFMAQVKRQEHFIEWATWLRDMNYLFERGGMGKMIDMNYGPKIKHQVLNFIKDVGSPQTILEDIERLGNKILSNASVAMLSLNALTMLKQLPSFASAFRDEVDMRDFFIASANLSNPAKHKELMDFIYEKSPLMKKRQISIELAAYENESFSNPVWRASKKFNDKIGMKGIQMMDHIVVSTLWLARYNTFIRNNQDTYQTQSQLENEAAFQATKFIQETQPSSLGSDTSSLQKNKSPWVRAFLLFSNQIFQYMNMALFDIPAAWRTKDIRHMMGLVANLAISGGLIILTTGAFFRGAGEDDEEWLKRILNEVAQMAATYTIPLVGNEVASGISGWSSGSGIIQLPVNFGRLIGEAIDGDWDKVADRAWDVGGDFGTVSGLPTVFVNRVVKSVREDNMFYFLNKTYGDLMDGR